MERRNQRKLLLALIVLLVGLTVAVVKNRGFWFGNDDAAESENTAAASTPNVRAAAPVNTQAPASNASTQATTKGLPVPKNSAVGANIAPAEVERPEVERAEVIAGPPTELPPMEVEVVAGESHRTLRPGSNSVLVVMPPTSAFHSASAAFKWTPVTNAAERTRISPDQPERLEKATYPALARDMKVKGSVLLQASVGADGGIRNLRVVSGNPILTSAAKEAARQWRFRPYLRNGQPVPAQQQITVNFTIKVL